jgi:hypothetical protein
MSAALVKSEKRTCNEQLTDVKNLIRPLVPFDGGNRTIQWVDPLGTVHTIPSFIKPIDSTWEDVTPDENSVVIEFEGATFVVGQVAQDLQVPHIGGSHRLINLETSTDTSGKAAGAIAPPSDSLLKRLNRCCKIRFSYQDAAFE